LPELGHERGDLEVIGLAEDEERGAAVGVARALADERR
jgi:hypothetical protein